MPIPRNTRGRSLNRIKSGQKTTSHGRRAPEGELEASPTAWPVADPTGQKLVEGIERRASEADSNRFNLLDIATYVCNIFRALIVGHTVNQQTEPAMRFLGRYSPAAALSAFTFICAVGSWPSHSRGALIITGVLDGTISGGPKVVELYATADIGDLSVFRLDHFKDGSTSAGGNIQFSGSVLAGSFFYAVSSDSTDNSLNTWFGQGVVTVGVNAFRGSLTIDGDDALRVRTGSSTARDLFGNIGADGTGQPWEYMDGWAYRVSGTTADTTSFTTSKWYFSGPNALDGASSNAGSSAPFPIGTYSMTPVPEPNALQLAGSVLMLTVAGTWLQRRRHGPKMA